MAEKRYYTTKEVAEMFGVEESTVRYWEKTFPHLRPKRDSRNRRMFTQENMEVIRQIIYQKEVQGRTNTGAVKQLNHRESAENLIHRLQRVREFLIEVRDILKN